MESVARLGVSALSALARPPPKPALQARREQIPSSRQALRRLRTSLGEFQAGASDEIRDHSGNKNLARRSMRHDASRGVHGDAADIQTSQFDLAGMQTGAPRQADLFRIGLERQRAPNPAAGAAECRENALRCGLDERRSRAPG
jgi:hypothetical protein